MKRSALDKAIAKIQSEIDILEAVKARLVEQEKPRAPRKPRAVKPPTEKAG